MGFRIQSDMYIDCILESLRWSILDTPFTPYYIEVELNNSNFKYLTRKSPN
jgi:hypothetical protein